MAASATTLILLPERRRFATAMLSPGIAAMLGRADRLANAAPGEQAQLARYFTLPSVPHWPMAAIQRQYDVGDAFGATWLRADPAYVRADMTGARLLAWGNLALDDRESAAFIRDLAPSFLQMGCQLTATASDRWYVSFPAGTTLPTFSSPEQALGADLFEHLPQGEEGRRWRALLSETQVILHNHPGNVERAALGKAPVNSLWFWGGGALPSAITMSVSAVESPDAALQALAALAHASATSLVLHDLRHARDWSMVEKQLPRDSCIVLDFADGARWKLQPRQRWRFWRRPLSRLLE